MKRLLTTLILSVFLTSVSFGGDNELSLFGRVKDAVTKADILHAKVLLYDSIGNVRDTLLTNQGRRWNRDGVDTLSEFGFGVPRVDSTYVFDIICDGYKDQTVTWEVKNVGKRERWRDMQIVYLERAPRQLKEVTVVSSKIKFYNKGDTIVYNADAFDLAEGSMLDALIAQLPGAELNTNGQIKVNGQFVESLLLNGKQFFDKNNNMMLENIAAYTVKDIQVYEGQSIEAKRTHDETAPKVLTMNVSLKKEYNMGWLLNAQAGYGTHNRYMGRVFANWFNTTTRVSLIGNVNNLNDNRKPGRSDTWTPEQMPSGTKEYRRVGIDCDYTDVEEKKSYNGNVTVEQTIDKVNSSTSTFNFQPGTYDQAYGSSRNRDLSVSTSHWASVQVNSQLSTGIGISGSITDTKNLNTDLSAAFNEDPGELTYQTLDALLSGGDDELLASLLNRAKIRSDARYKSHNIGIRPNLFYRIPKTNDYLNFSFEYSYNGMKQDSWKDYEINYGQDPEKTERQRRYSHLNPNSHSTLSVRLGYTRRTDHNYFSLNYQFKHQNSLKDSYVYTLDRLAEMGIFGVLPEGYESVLDPGNSYDSRLISNAHSINPFYSFYKEWEPSGYLNIRIAPEINIEHRNFSFLNNDRLQKLSKDYTSVTVSSIWSAMIEGGFRGRKKGERTMYTNSIRYSYRLTPTLPDPYDIVEMDNTNNPLNIYVGNPDLRVEYRHNHLFRWSYEPVSHNLNNILYLGFTHTDRALTQGYTYNTTTGQRINKKYNVDGNRTAAVTNELSWQFGAKSQFTLSSTTDVSRSRLHDMIGIDVEAPQLTKVKTLMSSEKINFWWNIGKQTIGLRCDYTNRHTTSERQGFNTLNANHFNYGVSGVFNLPAGFGISTDFTCYTRRGYGSDNLDTTDPIWNMRVSYNPPRAKKWVFMVDGFDLLRKISNVNYAVTASGRTVSYTNALPRYILFSVQYRLNIQPKKR